MPTSEKQKAAEKAALDKLGRMGFTEDALLRALVAMFLAGVAWKEKHNRAGSCSVCGKPGVYTITAYLCERCFAKRVKRK